MAIMFCPVCGSEIKDGNNCKNCNYSFNNSAEGAIGIKENFNAQKHVIEECRAGEIDARPKENNTADNKKSVKKTSKRKIIIPIVIISVVLITVFIAIAGVGIGYLVYINSDGYKTEQAEFFILEGDYETGIEEISDVHTTEADTLRGFVDLLIAKDEYVETVKSDNEFGEYSISVYYDFQEAVKYFESEYDSTYLCDELESEYKKISESVELVDELYNDDLRGKLIDVQLVHLNMVDRYRSDKGGPYFTIRTFQERVDVSEEAREDILDNYNMATETWALDWFVEFEKSELPENCYIHCFEDYPGEYYVPLSGYGQNICAYMMSDSAIFNSNAKIRSLLEKFEVDDELFITEPDFDYVSDMGDNLIDIDDYSDIENNATTVVECLKIEVLYYFLVGETPDNLNIIE